ncbi:helix-turn-helix domain-containing protein [Nocardiopsis dassonvillei]|uniref:helix-turn-helix transcriptional regulator n=1 Tax=Nocardiopsis dassonvillei TaxID=2014 RepID=UPI00200F29C8|nr:helix-turn-helix transcriptional regulator [Nocardiopsis dassonvillei]MCK9869380.1 helix-turn-helix domain-containing protein [Nocardiopsis dassonvillei]
MNEITSIGRRLRARRLELGWTQEELAERSGLSSKTVGQLERAAKLNFAWVTIVRLAQAMDLDPSEINGKRNRVSPINDSGGVLAVRNAVYDPAYLPGLPSEATGEPSTVVELQEGLERAYGAYFSGEFAVLAAELPDLLARCRATQTHLGRPEVAGVYSHVWQLAACLLTQTGKVDAALAATERAIATAQDDRDEWRSSTMYGTYSWVLLHAGRHEDGEKLAVQIADTIRPELAPGVDPRRLVAWGGLMLHAAVLAGGAGRADEADEYLAYARAGAGLLEEDRHDYWVSFGPSHVGVQTAHINTGLQRPEKALRADRAVRSQDLFAVQQARHLLNVSAALRVRGRREQAEVAAGQAVRIGGREWFRQQRFGATLVSLLEQDATRTSGTLRGLRGIIGESTGAAV